MLSSGRAITSDDGPGENVKPPKLLSVGRPAEVAEGCPNLHSGLVEGPFRPPAMES